MPEILSKEKGKKLILMGNQGVVRGALESGIGIATTYPGTPSTEIAETFSDIAKEAGIYFEYSTNEKVAFEAACAAAMSGVRSIVSFKHYGLNVACDSVFPSAYLGVKAGLVIAVADDPGCWSSVQNEEDSRPFAPISHLPMLEPSNPQECIDFTKKAFDLSEKFGIPVYLHLATRVSHMRAIIRTGEIVEGKKKGKFEKGIAMRNFTPEIMGTHELIHKKLEEIEKVFEKSDLNTIINGAAKSKMGIIATGISYNYVVDSMEHLGVKIPVLKLGTIYPMPQKLIGDFIRKFKTVLVVEELEPFVEDKVRMIAKDANPKLEILGKNILPRVGEYNEETILSHLCGLTGKKFCYSISEHKKKFDKIKIARRFPTLCAGCPHRATFYAAKVAGGKDVVYPGDVGCYILGVFPPYETSDFIFSMGASQGLGHGIRKATDQNVISFIGDSTFFHGGMPGLVNTVFNKSNALTIVLDNRITAMTGQQPNPGMGVTGMGDSTKMVNIEEVVKALGVENVAVVDPYNLKLTTDTIRDFLTKETSSVIIAKRECRLLTLRKMKKQGIKLPTFEIDDSLCKSCGKCLNEFACPAITNEGGKYRIDKDMCTGCSVCAQLCPNKAIRAAKQ